LTWEEKKKKGGGGGGGGSAPDTMSFAFSTGLFCAEKHAKNTPPSIGKHQGQTSKQSSQKFFFLSDEITKVYKALATQSPARNLLKPVQ